MKINLNHDCMYCGKKLKNRKCDCEYWSIIDDYNSDNDIESQINNKTLSEEEQSILFLEQLIKEVKAEFEYQCPNCLGKFNKPHTVKLKGTHYYCPFCGLYMTGLSNVQ